MAKQTGIIRLKGTIGGISFYKTSDGHLAREKGGVEASRKGLESSPQYLDIIDITAPTITRVTYRVTELFCFDFDELCSTKIRHF